MASVISERLLVRAARHEDRDGGPDDLSALSRRRERLLSELEDVERRLRGIRAETGAA